jgi:chromosome segregation ATPase
VSAGLLRDILNVFPQGEAHRSNLQLQHLSVQHRDVTQKCHYLEEEQNYLVRELGVLRNTAAMVDDAGKETLQIQELILSLRKLSDQLDLAEREIMSLRQGLAASRTETEIARRLQGSALESLKVLQLDLGKREAEKRQLVAQLKSEEQQRAMSDLVLEEYADLVRNLEGRRTTEGRVNRASVDGLQHARNGLQKLLNESNEDAEKLHAQIAQLYEALEQARRELQVERDVSVDVRKTLVETQTQLEKYERDDQAAAKMVSRYMSVLLGFVDII